MFITESGQSPLQLTDLEKQQLCFVLQLILILSGHGETRIEIEFLGSALLDAQKLIPFGLRDRFEVVRKDDPEYRKLVALLEAASTFGLLGWQSEQGVVYLTDSSVRSIWQYIHNPESLLHNLTISAQYGVERYFKEAKQAERRHGE